MTRKVSGGKITPITSFHNSRIKFIRSLHETSVRKGSKKYFVEGLKLCQDAILSEAAIDFCLVNSSFETTAEGKDFLSQVARKKIEVAQVTDDLYKKISDLENPQGVLCVANQPEASLETLAGHKGPLRFIFAEKVQDPGNIGAILRTIEALGASGLVISGGGVDVFHPKVVRSSMGAIFRCPIFEAENLRDWLDQSKKFRVKMQVVAADSSAKKELFQINFSICSTIVIGSEGQGLSRESLSLSDEIIRIPMAGKAESLNVAVATGILLFCACTNVMRPKKY